MRNVVEAPWRLGSKEIIVKLLFRYIPISLYPISMSLRTLTWTEGWLAKRAGGKENAVPRPWVSLCSLFFFFSKINLKICLQLDISEFHSGSRHFIALLVWANSLMSLRLFHLYVKLR